MLYALEDPAFAGAPRRLAGLGIQILAHFVSLACTIRRHHGGILAAIRLGLSNSRLEGLNSRIRPISPRSLAFNPPHP